MWRAKLVDETGDNSAVDECFITSQSLDEAHESGYVNEVASTCMPRFRL